ncbi:hypothetical protein G9A89_016357 [Geosiphon pyriformis]|nr:hypothetical protein G9A89_016357 [Geosiphon pyriformis]
MDPGANKSGVGRVLADLVNPSGGDRFMDSKLVNQRIIQVVRCFVPLHREKDLISKGNTLSYDREGDEA